MPNQRTTTKPRKRDDLMSAVKDRDVDQLIDITKSAKGSELSDAVAELSKAKLEEFWANVYGLCTSSLMSCGDVEDSEFTVKMNLILKSATDLAQATVSALLAQKSNIGDDDKTALGVPQSLQESVILLHGLLPNIEDSQTSLKNQMSRLFEDWWNSNLEGRQDLASNTILYLLDRSTQPKAFQNDVSRVWAMRDVLECSTLSSEQSNTLVSLLKQCIHHPQFISTKHGIRFLAFILRLNPDLTNTLHQCIKNVLFTTPRSWHAKYGEVYFRSWQEAGEEMRQTIEECCIQDLMFRAIHASRQGSYCPAATLNRVMSYLHKQKTQRGMESVLVRLYGPILWRSLKVPNSDIRLNAASLLFNAFPLQDPNHHREEADAALQKQFDVMSSLLSDPVVEIRVAAVLGIGRVLCMYWELIPVQVIQTLVTTLVQDMVYDTASPNVREAVLKVMYQLCDNHLCIPMLKKVLPELGNFIHDTSEKVRVAMLDLLLKVKGLRAIKYWSIVPIEHILARLEMDSRFVVRRIMSLISASFVPQNHPPSQQVERCLALISSNRGAARQFYVNLPKSLGVVDTAKYILVLCRYALESTRLWSQNSVSGHLQSEDRNEDISEGDSSKIVKSNSNNNSSNSGKRRRSSRLSEREDESSTDRSVAGTSQSGEDVFDMDSLSGLMEAVYLMFTAIVSQLSSPEHSGMKEGLMKKLSVTVRELIKISDDPLLEDALVGLAGHLPSRTLPLVSQNLFNKLKQRDCSRDVIGSSLSSNSFITNMVKTLVQWGRADDLFELVEESITALMKKDVESPVKGVKHSPKGRRKAVAFNTEESTIEVEKALQILSDMLSHAECRPILMKRHKVKIAGLVQRLEMNVFRKVQEHLKTLAHDGDNGDKNGARRKTGKTGSDSDTDMLVLISVFNSCLRLAVFLCLKPVDQLTNKDNQGSNDSNDDDGDETNVGYDFMRNCLAWIIRVVLPSLQSLPDPMITQTQHRYHHLLSQLVGSTVRACSGLVMIGINDRLISDQVGEICLTLLQLPPSSMTKSLMQSVLVFTYQLTQLRQAVDSDKENANGVEVEELMEADQGDEGMKANAPSKHPLEFALSVLKSTFRFVSLMNDEEEQSSCRSKRDSRGSKSKLKNKTAIDDSADATGSSNTPSISMSAVLSSVTSIITALIRPGLCSMDLCQKAARLMSNLIIQDLERLSRLELIGQTTTATDGNNDDADADGAGGGDDVVLTGLNQNILTCLKKQPKTMNLLTGEVISHLESDQVSIYSLQGVVYLTEALKTKSSVTINPDLKDAVSECLKTITPNGMDEDVFRDVKGQVEQRMKVWNGTRSSDRT